MLHRMILNRLVLLFALAGFLSVVQASQTQFLSSTEACSARVLSRNVSWTHEIAIGSTVSHRKFNQSLPSRVGVLETSSCIRVSALEYGKMDSSDEVDRSTVKWSLVLSKTTPEGLMYDISESVRPHYYNCQGSQQQIHPLSPANCFSVAQENRRMMTGLLSLIATNQSQLEQKSGVLERVRLFLDRIESHYLAQSPRGILPEAVLGDQVIQVNPQFVLKDSEQVLQGQLHASYHLYQESDWRSGECPLRYRQNYLLDRKGKPVEIPLLAQVDACAYQIDQLSLSIGYPGMDADASRVPAIYSIFYDELMAPQYGTDILCGGFRKIKDWRDGQEYDKLQCLVRPDARSTELIDSTILWIGEDHLFFPVIQDVVFEK